MESASRPPSPRAAVAPADPTARARALVLGYRGGVAAFRTSALLAALLGATGCGLILDLDPSDDPAKHDAGTHRDAGRRDAGIDAGTADAGAGDAATDAATSHDAGRRDGGHRDAGRHRDGGIDGGCNPDAIHFPGPGDLAPGTLCDDIFVCVSDESTADAIRRVAPSFECERDSSSFGECTDFACFSSPSLLEEDEIREICAVTLVLPAEHYLICRVYVGL